MTKAPPIVTGRFAPHPHQHADNPGQQIPPPTLPKPWVQPVEQSGWIADKDYIGKGMITPHKKPPNGELSEAAKEANKSINRIRQVVERTIAHIKSWKILHTDYRHPCTHSSGPSPQPSHSTSSKPLSE